MRKENILKNLKCQTFNNEINSIDIYYPIAYYNEKSIGIANYGYRYKDDYTIEELNIDTLVIYNGRRYVFDNKKYYDVRHVYLRR